jgi:hypothetical protein
MSDQASIKGPNCGTSIDVNDILNSKKDITKTVDTIEKELVNITKSGYGILLQNIVHLPKYNQTNSNDMEFN